MPIVNHVKTHAHEHIRNLQFTLFTLETFTRLHKGSEWVGGYSGLFHKGSFSPINFFYELLNKFFSIKNVKVLFDYYSDSEKSSTKSSKQHKKTDSRRPIDSSPGQALTWKDYLEHVLVRLSKVHLHAIFNKVLQFSKVLLILKRQYYCLNPRAFGLSTTSTF